MEVRFQSSLSDLANEKFDYFVILDRFFTLNSFNNYWFTDAHKLCTWGVYSITFWAGLELI